MPLIRVVSNGDSAAIADIYNHYVTNTIVTFEEEPVTVVEMSRRIDAALATSLPWLVAVEAGRVVGYAYASVWKVRPAYRFSAESTVYVDHRATARGIGSALYERLFVALRSSGVHTVIGGIALPNDASIAIHEKLGMTKVAHFAEVGFKFGRWIDVAYWQRTP